jgi:hypothetical protein
MPDNIVKQTKVVKRSIDIVIEELLEFENLDISQLVSRYFEISVHELDKVKSKEECIGVASLKLNFSNIEDKRIFTKDLKPFIKTADQEVYIGDIMFSLTYLPAAERLTVVIMKCRNIRGVGTERKNLPG